MKKKLKYILQLIDGIWSVPLGFFAFFFCGLMLSSFFGMAVGQYDLAFIQPLFLAGTVVVGATNMAVMGLYFTFRGIFHYLYGNSNRYFQGKIFNPSKQDYYLLTPNQRICVSLVVFFFFFFSILLVYLNLV